MIINLLRWPNTIISNVIKDYYLQINDLQVKRNESMFNRKNNFHKIFLVIDYFLDNF